MKIALLLLLTIASACVAPTTSSSSSDLCRLDPDRCPGFPVTVDAQDVIDYAATNPGTTIDPADIVCRRVGAMGSGYNVCYAHFRLLGIGWEVACVQEDGSDTVTCGAAQDVGFAPTQAAIQPHICRLDPDQCPGFPVTVSAQNVIDYASTHVTDGTLDTATMICGTKTVPTSQHIRSCHAVYHTPVGDIMVECDQFLDEDGYIDCTAYQVGGG